MDYLLGQSSIFAKLKKGHKAASYKAEGKDVSCQPHHHDANAGPAQNSRSKKKNMEGPVANGEEEELDENSSHVIGRSLQVRPKSVL
jgi:hypothetical protein